ncbi:MAG: DUF86 domain-containing protein [Deltaproteobacteria bacterium]|nr:DUF86 domain-containing protein [Deltaproteobacteria bacterium]
MVNQLIMERLFSLIKGYLNDLKPVRGISFSHYSKDIRLQRFVERTLQIAIEASLDIGNHIISDEGFREPQDNRDIFRVLRENGIIPEGLQKKLENMASFRNLIVHSYAKIDNEIVFGILKKRMDDMEAFMKAVSKRFFR